MTIRPGVTPVPIPNTMVKPRTADGTMLATVWESRRLPDLIARGDPTKLGRSLAMPEVANALRETEKVSSVKPLKQKLYQ